jgi:hypothetical protein
VRRALAILLLVSGWIVPLAIPHPGADDTLCIPASERSGAAKAQLDAASTQNAPDHCAICHSARTFRSGIAHSGFVLVGLSPGDLLGGFENPVHVTSAVVRLPARAPPLV